MSIEKVKRVCLVTDAGRIYDEMDLADVKIAIQDNGITLKIFTSKDDKLTLPEDSQNDLSRTGRNIDNDTDFFSLFDRFDLKNPTTMIAWKQIKDDVIYHFTKIITKNAL